MRNYCSVPLSCSLCSGLAAEDFWLFYCWSVRGPSPRLFWSPELGDFLCLWMCFTVGVLLLCFQYLILCSSKHIQTWALVWLGKCCLAEPRPTFFRAERALCFTFMYPVHCAWNPVGWILLHISLHRLWAKGNRILNLDICDYTGWILACAPLFPAWSVTILFAEALSGDGLEIKLVPLILWQGKPPWLITK